MTSGAWPSTSAGRTSSGRQRRWTRASLPLRWARLNHLAPVAVVDPARLGGPEELEERISEPLWILDVGEVRGSGQGLEVAPRDRLVGAATVGEGDRVVALTPDDQGRKPVQEVEPVASADVLAATVDHRAQRLEEGAAGACLPQGPQGPGDRQQVDAEAAAPDRKSVV